MLRVLNQWRNKPLRHLYLSMSLFLCFGALSPKPEENKTRKETLLLHGIVSSLHSFKKQLVQTFFKSILLFQVNHSINHIINHIWKCSLLFSPLMLKLDGSGRPSCKVQHGSTKFNKTLTPSDLFSPQNVHLLFWVVSLWLFCMLIFNISITKIIFTADG